MRISDGYSKHHQNDSGFDRAASRAERQAERQDRRAERQAQRAAEREQRQADRAERREARQAMRPHRPDTPDSTRPSGGGQPMPVEPDGGIGDGAGPIPFPSGPIPVEPDGGIGDGAGPIPFPPEATTLALGEEDGGAGPFPEDPDGPFPIGGGPIPVEPDGGIGDGAGPIPFPPEATTLALGEEDGGVGPFPIGGGPGPIGGPIPIEPGRGDGKPIWPFPFPPGNDPRGGPVKLPMPILLPGGPIEPAPGRVQPPEASGSYRLGGNDLGANFLNFNGDGTARILGAQGTDLTFGSVRTGDDGSIFGEKGSGTINGDPVRGGVGFKLSIAPNDAGYVLTVKANGQKTDIQAGPNGIVPPNPTEPVEPTEPPSRGGGLLFLYRLGENSLGATGVTLNTDGTGQITGPDVDIALSGGGYDDSGAWVATAGAGKVNGHPVMLKANADGNVFVASGEGGLADMVSAWLSDGREFNAAVVAVAQP